MTAAKAYNVQLAAVTNNLPAGSTKGSPGIIGAALDYSAAGATATLTASLQNGSSAPGSPAVLVAQISGDGQVWRDWLPVAGDTISNSFYTFSARLPPEGKFGRWVGYGNTTNAVTVSFESFLSTSS